MNAIEVYRVGKTYRIPHERHTTLVERLTSAFRPADVELLRALEDVSLEVPAGAFVGVIGSNGSGKSTLLKLMAGVLVPDTGQITIHGKLVPLLELGLGFHQELTVRENVALYGAVLGYPIDTVAERIDRVVAFAELGRFMDAKLKSLSSGMIVRLAFATALHADGDILLLDEVMAVGDARFQRKCLDVFAELKLEKKTIVLVSHDLSSVTRFCDKAFWLDKGRLVMSGDATQVVYTYLSAAQIAVVPESPPIESTETTEHRFGDGRMRFTRGRLETPDGQPATNVPSGTPLVLRLEAEAYAACTDPAFGIMVKRGAEMVYSTNNVLLGVPSGTFAPGDRIEVTFPLRAALANGHYFVCVAIANTADSTVHDWINHLCTFIVDGSPCLEGLADLAAEFHCTVERGDGHGSADTATSA